jgi:hypothetical protein
MIPPEGGGVAAGINEDDRKREKAAVNAATVTAVRAAPVAGAARRPFQAPFKGDAVLYLVRSARK